MSEAAEAAVQFNISDYIPLRGYSFDRLPMPFLPRNCGIKLTSTALLLLADIFTKAYSTDAPEATCRRAIADFVRQFKYARSTVCDALSKLVGEHFVRKTKLFHAPSEYTIEGIDSSAPFIQIEDYFRTTEFPIKTENGVIYRMFTDSEVITLAIIATFCKNPEHKEGEDIFTATVAQLADMVGVCEKTMVEILNALTGSNLVICLDKPKRKKRWDHQKMLRFRIHKRLKKQMNNKHLTSKKPARIEKAKEARTAAMELEAQRVREANARTDREQFYSTRKDSAEAPVRRAEAILKADEAYANVERTVRFLSTKLVKAEHYNTGEASALEGQLQEAERQREECKEQVLKKHGLALDVLIPKYQCADCSDSGFLPNGVCCECYERERRPKRFRRWKPIRRIK